MKAKSQENHRSECWEISFSHPEQDDFEMNTSGGSQLLLELIKISPNNSILCLQQIQKENIELLKKFETKEGPKQWGSYSFPPLFDIKVMITDLNKKEIIAVINKHNILQAAAHHKIWHNNCMLFEAYDGFDDPVLVSKEYLKYDPTFEEKLRALILRVGIYQIEGMETGEYNLSSFNYSGSSKETKDYLAEKLIKFSNEGKYYTKVLNVVWGENALKKTKIERKYILEESIEPAFFTWLFLELLALAFLPESQLILLLFFLLYFSFKMGHPYIYADWLTFNKDNTFEVIEQDLNIIDFVAELKKDKKFKFVKRATTSWCPSRY